MTYSPQPVKLAAPVILALLLALGTAGMMFVLHPRLDIADADDVAYIMGARGIRSGLGYRNLTGSPLNHWPPGYSAVLSFFPDPVTAARVINTLSLGIAAALLYSLTQYSGWSWQAGLGLSLVLASGFFRLLAHTAHPDVTTYALFFVAILLASSRKRRLLPSILWSLLIPMKLIAVTFLPPAAGADRLASEGKQARLFRRYFPGLSLSAAAVAAYLVFNRVTLGQWIPASHQHSSLRTLASGLRMFAVSIPRSFLFSWYGPIAHPFPLSALVACLLAAGLCFVSLRPVPENRWFRMYGLLQLACTGLLLSVRHFDLSMRLVGYGVIVLLLGFRPKPWANPVWLSYGLLSLAVGAVNARAVNSLGCNDPRYVALAAAVRPYVPPWDTIATNSFYLLDLHASISSDPVTTYTDAARYRRFLWVTLPDFDPDVSAVTPMPHPGPEWCASRRFPGAVLFDRCGV